MPPKCAEQRLTTHAPAPAIFIAYDASDDTLAEATAPGRHLRTICRCGEVNAFDATAWLDRGLGFKHLSDFSGRLRCPCGGRQARFEVWPGSLATCGLVVRSAASLYG